MEYWLGPQVNSDITPWNGLSVRLREDARQCVVFFGLPNPKPDGDPIVYGGTGFFVLAFQPTIQPYLVTCRHVAKHLEQGPFFIRANTHAGPAEDITVDAAQWAYHWDETVDIAVAPYRWPDHLSCRTIPMERCLTEDRRKIYGIGAGDLVQIVGLFRFIVGKRRNLPVVHTGHIALIAGDEMIPSRDTTTGKITEREGYLVEAQTLQGLSGSPVFVRRSIQAMPLKQGTLSITDSDLPSGYGGVFLLGVYSGAWEAEPGSILAADRGFTGNIRVPIGMGVVVPAQRIIETITQEPVVEKQRTQYQWAGRPPATEDSALPTKADNPSHKEDFKKLLDAAVKGPKSDPKTSE